MKQGFRRTAAAFMTLSVLGSAVTAMSIPVSAEARTGLKDFRDYWTMQDYTIPGTSAECVVNPGKTAGPYYLYNRRLNIKMTDYDSYMIGNSMQNCPQKKKLYTLSGRGDDNWNDYVKMMSNAANAYDFYRSLGFEYMGADTSMNSSLPLDKTIYIAPMQQDDWSNPKPQLDATSAFGVMVFGNGDDSSYSVGTAYDVVLHEFTHLVTQQICDWSYSNMVNYKNVGRLAEAYSDIMAELGSGNTDWMIGTDVFQYNYSNQPYCFRNLRDPANTRRREGNKAYYTHYSQLLADPNNSDLYLGSTIISHAAYLMYAAGISVYDLQRIWYQSLELYPVTSDGLKNITFFTCRDNVIKAAQNYYKSKGYSGTRLSGVMKKVIHAFEEVGLGHCTSIDQERAESASNMANFIAAKKNVLKPNEYWTGRDPNASVPYSGVYDDHLNYVPGGPVVYQNFNMAFWQDQEPYYQCAGFAKKLQSDYFGTSVVTRITAYDISEYHPRIGDHLRVRSSYTGPVEDKEHSVFITAVNGNSFTYADANSDGYNVIRYDCSGSVSGSGSNLTIRLGSVNNSFVFVERPIKLGDVNADGELDSKDLTALNAIQNGTAPTFMVDTMYRTFAADPSGDGIVDSNDISYVRNLIAHNYYIRFFGYVR